MEGFTLSQETQTEINALKQRAYNYANQQLARSFNVVHADLEIYFSVEVSLVVKAGKPRGVSPTSGISIACESTAGTSIPPPSKKLAIDWSTPEGKEE